MVRDREQSVHNAYNHSAMEYQVYGVITGCLQPLSHGGSYPSAGSGLWGNHWKQGTVIAQCLHHSAMEAATVSQDQVDQSIMNTASYNEGVS